MAVLVPVRGPGDPSRDLRARVVILEGGGGEHESGGIPEHHLSRDIDLEKLDEDQDADPDVLVGLKELAKARKKPKRETLH